MDYFECTAFPIKQPSGTFYVAAVKAEEIETICRPLTRPVEVGLFGRAVLAWKMHRFGRIERKALMLRMIEIASQISGVFAKRPSTNDSPWLLSGL